MDPNHLPAGDSAPYHEVLFRCVDDWGLVPQKTSLLRDGVNHVFATETVDGAPVIVRISDGDIRERGELDGELIWLDHLIRHGCTVTTPIPSRAGDLLETFAVDAGTYHACCFERFGGRELYPKADPEWNDALLLELGREIARIHRASDELTLPPGHNRHQSQSNRWGHNRWGHNRWGQTRLIGRLSRSVTLRAGISTCRRDQPQEYRRRQSVDS